MTTQTEQLLAHLGDVVPWHLNFHHDVHRHPELSFCESRTSRLIADRLTELGYRVQTGLGGTGLVGVLDNGAGSTVLARADMDALPVRESSGLPYASVETATDPRGMRCR